MYLKKEVTSEGELADVYDCRQQETYYALTLIFSSDMKLYENGFVITVLQFNDQ